MKAPDRIHCEWDPDRRGPYVNCTMFRYGTKWQARLGRRDFVTVQMAATLLGVSVMTIHNWLTARPPRLKMHEHRGTGTRMIQVADLYSFAQSQNLLPPDPDEDDLIYRST